MKVRDMSDFMVSTINHFDVKFAVAVLYKKRVSKSICTRRLMRVLLFGGYKS